MLAIPDSYREMFISVSIQEKKKNLQDENMLMYFKREHKKTNPTWLMSI